MRYDLAFLLCCCKSFLGSDHDDENDDDDNNNNNTQQNDPNNTNKKTFTNEKGEKIRYTDYYKLLGVEKHASVEELKRAYKRQSLQYHPDKLAQRGIPVTPAAQLHFTKMKEAYEVLSDPHKRDTYDALGARGVQWLEEPNTALMGGVMDPSTLAHNFAKSSALDRSKIFAIFLGVAVAVLILPILVCLHVDGVWGVHASWMATLTPLWIWNLVLIFYHTRVILLGPIPRPEHIPIEEWVDPLPMKKRIFSMMRFLLIVIGEVFVALKLDHILTVPWSVVFSPLYIWECTTLYKKWPLARMRIVTVEDLEGALGKPFSEFTPAEKELIGKRYSVVASTSSPDFDAAQKLKLRARNDVIKSTFRIVFVLALIVQLDGEFDWNWWLVFSPIWVMSLLVCCDNYQSFEEVRQTAMDKDPTLFIPNAAEYAAAAHSTETGTSSYGAVNETTGGATTADAAAATLTNEEREQLRAQINASSSKLCNKCCSHGFVLVIVFLIVAKLQGAGFSAFWIISPFLFLAGMLLCCIGCAIFGITEVSTDGIHFDASADFAYTNAEEGTAAPGTAAPVAAPSSNVAATSTVFVPPPPPPPTILTDQTTSDSAPDVTIDSPAVPIVMAEVENDATIFPVVNENHQAETMAVATDATRANPDDGATTLDSLPPGEIQGLD